MMRLIGALCLFCGLISGQTARAQEGPWPSQAVRVIVPFPAGGPADIIARFVSERLAQTFNQSFVIENKPGANTAIAAAQVAKAPANGYTLLVVMDVTMVLNPLTVKTLSYDPMRDFAPISLLAKNATLLTVHADGPKSVAELVAKAKATPAKINFGAGILTTRLAGELFARESGFSVQYVPFQGSPPTVQALLSKSVDFIIDGQASSLPLIQAGTFRALAKSNREHIPPLPNLKSLAEETGSAALEDISTWIGLVAPTGTPQSIIDKLQKEIARIYAEPGLKARLLDIGITPAATTPTDFTSFMRNESTRWGKVVRESGIELN